MANWLSSMQQTFEYYTVDPGTWKDKRLLTNIKSSSISRDANAGTLGSATVNTTEALGECYMRTYLITVQNGIKEKHALGTHLIQTPSVSFNGKVPDYSVDSYTPLLELKESMPLIGYTVPKDSNIMAIAYELVREHVRAPVIPAVCDKTIPYDFVASPEDTWLSFISDLIANAKYTLALDELGRILFSPKQEIASLAPVWTYDDSNSSILYPEISLDNDLYGIPNVVEVIYSNSSTAKTTSLYSRVVNDDENSPVSTVNRGREIVYRDTNPSISGIPTQDMLNEYAASLLKGLSTLECTISYSHGYCPVRLGDCVRFNYKKIGLTDVKAKVISQDIECKPGCPVSEKAVFTTKLWGDA